MKRVLLLAALVLTTVLSGCVSFVSAGYSDAGPPPQPMSFSPEGGVQIGAFDSGPADVLEITCRQVGPVRPYGGITFSEYIRRALAKELSMPKRNSDSAGVVITGRVDSVDFSTMDDYWLVKVTLRSQDGREAKFSTIHKYTASWYGNKACEQAADSFAPAVKRLANEIKQSAEYRNLVLGAP